MQGRLKTTGNPGLVLDVLAGAPRASFPEAGVPEAGVPEGSGALQVAEE